MRRLLLESIFLEKDLRRPEMNNKHGQKFSVHCRIRLEEHLDDTWSDWFEHMTITTQNNVTTLEGRIPDQAALHGLLIRIRDLNLTLLDVQCGYDYPKHRKFKTQDLRRKKCQQLDQT